MQKDGLPEPISRLIEELTKLPGIGEKNATRLAFHIYRSSEEYAKNLSDAIIDSKSKVISCSRCHNFSSDDPCSICSDLSRKNNIICVVEQPLDLIAIEKSREYEGLYHVLHGVISPLDGIGPEDLTIDSLLKRIESENFSEVILATNSNVEGEATSMYISRLLKPINITASRLAHGIPVGTELEYIDELTLGKAIRDRKEI